jgi:hypothetical protein
VFIPPATSSVHSPHAEWRRFSESSKEYASKLLLSDSEFAMKRRV